MASCPPLIERRALGTIVQDLPSAPRYSGDSDTRSTDEIVHSYMGSFLCKCAGLHRPSLRPHVRPYSSYLVQVVWGLCRAGGLGQGRNTYDLGQAIQGGIDAFVTSIEIAHGRAGAHTMAVAHLPRDSSHAVFPHLLCGGKAREQGSPAAARAWRPQ